MPAPAECAAVAVLLAGAAATTAIATFGGTGRIAGASRTLASVAAGGLLLRGIGGVAADATGLGDPAPEFHTWNRRLYNPLCLVLGASIALGVHGNTR